MILLREIQEQDLDALESFAKIPGFINLPDDRDLLREKIQRSIAAFKAAPPGPPDAKYIFVAEDLTTHRVLGTSMVAAQHGTPDSPHYYFEVASEEKFSQTINTGFIHGTLKLKFDSNGPSEIGALVVDPASRHTDAKIGRQISFVRFLFLGLNKNRFKRKVIAELLPPLNKQGKSPLWEAVGRRFTNMDYWEADKLAAKDKEFILSLFPSGKIYTTFLPAEARNAIGKVGKETEPVMHMLTKIGFQYKNQVDPFDGGPHFWATVDEIVPIKKTASCLLGAAGERAKASPGVAGLICRAPQAAGQKPGQFRALGVQAEIKAGRILLSDPELEQVKAALGLAPGDSAVFMPYY